MEATEQYSTELFLDDYARTSTGKRFANYIIDVIVFYIIVFLVSFVIAITYPPFVDFIEDDHDTFPLADRIISLLLYALYMSFTETIFKGKSLVKLITKTRAVNYDGTQISTATAFGRGFSRAVPFAVFSALGTPCNPWHDRWNNTMVVDESTLAAFEQRKLMPVDTHTTHAEETPQLSAPSDSPAVIDASEISENDGSQTANDKPAEGTNITE